MTHLYLSYKGLGLTDKHIFTTALTDKGFEVSVGKEDLTVYYQPEQLTVLKDMLLYHLYVSVVRDVFVREYEALTEADGVLADMIEEAKIEYMEVTYYAQLLDVIVSDVFREAERTGQEQVTLRMKPFINFHLHGLRKEVKNMFFFFLGTDNIDTISVDIPEDYIDDVRASALLADGVEGLQDYRVLSVDVDYKLTTLSEKVLDVSYYNQLTGKVLNVNEEDVRDKHVGALIHLMVTLTISGQAFHPEEIRISEAVTTKDMMLLESKIQTISAVIERPITITFN